MSPSTIPSAPASNGFMGIPTSEILATTQLPTTQTSLMGTPKLSARRPALHGLNDPKSSKSYSLAEPHARQGNPSSTATLTASASSLPALLEDEKNGFSGSEATRASTDSIFSIIPSRPASPFARYNKKKFIKFIEKEAVNRRGKSGTPGYVESPSATVMLHKSLQSFFNRSSQAIFIVSAKPLWHAICHRRFFGKAEDPEEHGIFSRSHPGSFNGLESPFLDEESHSSLTGSHIEAGSACNLSELLRSQYVNPVAADFACRALEIHPDKLDSPCDSWDMMKLLALNDLSRWMSWLRGVLEPSERSQTFFQTEIQTAGKYRESLQNSQKKRWRNFGGSTNSQRLCPNSSSTPKNRSPEIIMTATIIESLTGEGLTDTGSSEEFSDSDVIVFSSIILHDFAASSPMSCEDQHLFKHKSPKARSPVLSSSQEPPTTFSRSKTLDLAMEVASFPKSKGLASKFSPPRQRKQSALELWSAKSSQKAAGRGKIGYFNDYEKLKESGQAEELRDKKAVTRASNHRKARMTRGMSTGAPLIHSSPARFLTPYHNRHRSCGSLPLASYSDDENKPKTTSTTKTEFQFGSSPGNRSSSSQGTEFESFIFDGRSIASLARGTADAFLFSSPKRVYKLRTPHQEEDSNILGEFELDDEAQFKLSQVIKRNAQDSTPRKSLRNQSSTFSSNSSLGTLGTIDFCAEAFRKSLMITPMGHIILEFDWEKTPIGPIECWSPTLKSMVGMMLSSPYRTSLLWGEECVMLYNDAYVKTCGRKHPGLLGQSGSQGWAELWADLGEIADSVLRGETYTVYDSLLFFDRDPNNPEGIRKEECYHSFSWIPVRGPMGDVEGIFNTSFETTSRVISERRLRTLRDLVQITLVSKNRLSYTEGCLEVISKNPYDLPFAIMYTCETKKRNKVAANGSDDSSSLKTAEKAELQLTLAGSVAVPRGHPSAPEHLEITIPMTGSSSRNQARSSLDQHSPSISSTTSQNTVIIDSTAEEDSLWSLKEACTFGKPIYIADLGDRAKGFELRGWNDEPRSAVVMPLSTSESSPPLAVFIFGISPRLYWSEAYALFLNLLTRQLSTGLSAAIGHEEETERLEELAALNRAKTTFFTNISHELRTPLTLIVGPISEILESKLDISEIARDRLKVVERNTQRLINLVNQLLDLSRFEAGKMVARFRKTDFSKFAAGLVALFRSEMLKKKIELIVECPETPQRVWVDQDFIEKVIFNLMSNCMKFTPPGGQVTVQVRFDTTKCYLICSDTGVGIAKDELPRIFERFHRVENCQRKAEGTGIGLALVQDIVKLHQGNLDVESEINEGSKFTIAFQLGNEHLPPESIEYEPETELESINDRVMASNARRWMLGDIEPTQNSAMKASPSASDISSSRGSWDSAVNSAVQEGTLSTVGSTVLIADDNSDMRSFLTSILSRYFFVREASNGLEAYTWAKVHQPDVVITDVMMPIMDGFQLLKKLKSDSETAGISVILLSACAGSENRVEGLYQGADDYLVKPFEAKELVARINAHLQQSRMRQRLESAVTHRTELLRQNEQRYRDLYHTFEAISMLSPVGIIQLDVAGKITFANNSFHSQCNLPEGRPLTDWMEQIYSEDRDRMKQEFEALFQSRSAAKGEFRWQDGSWCFYELSPYYQGDDQFAGYLGCTTDVNERKESERKQLEAAEARARDAEESKRQQEAFIDMTSHEIRNPLHGIHQAAELLHTSLQLLHRMANLNDYIDGENLDQFRFELEEDIDAIESIQLCASHQSRIADDIINVSKLSMGLLTTIKTEFDLVSRVREVLSMYYIEAQQKHVDLQLQIGPGVENSEYIFADPNRLAQVTINFLSNALRYASNSDGHRSVTVKVEIFARCPEPQPDGRRIGNLRPLIAEAGDDLVFAQVAVQDTARGLSPEELAKLFARFAQANPTQDQYGGSGLGLYVSHRLIENHGGFIEVVSTKGVGSVFSFVIPARRGRGPASNSGTPRSANRRGFSRAIKEKEVPEMQPASTLLPAGSMPLSGGSMRISSPESNDGRSPRLPRPKSALQTKVIDFDSPAKSLPQSPVMSLMPKATHVLVVEDNVINIKVIKRQLTSKGYTVSVAMDGRKALDMIYADSSEESDLPPINIVLMDIQMPVMNGLEAIAELRAAEKRGDVKKRYPVIAVTGNARKEQTEQCLASGFDNICVKPYKIDDVEERMKILLEATRLKEAENEVEDDK